MTQQVAELFSSLGSYLDLVFVAVRVSKVERDEGLVSHQGAEQLNCTIRLNVVSTKTEVDQTAIVLLQRGGEQLEPSPSKAVLAQIQLSEFVAVLDDLADDLHRLITESNLSQVQLPCACLFVVFDQNIEETEHLLLAGVDNQVLALGHVKLKELLLLDALDFGHVVHLSAELADINLLNGGSFECHASAVLASVSVGSRTKGLLAARHGGKLLVAHSGLVVSLKLANSVGVLLLNGLLGG